MCSKYKLGLQVTINMIKYDINVIKMCRFSFLWAYWKQISTDCITLYFMISRAVIYYLWVTSLKNSGKLRYFFSYDTDMERVKLWTKAINYWQLFGLKYISTYIPWPKLIIHLQFYGIGHNQNQPSPKTIFIVYFQREIQGKLSIQQNKWQ